MTDHLRVVHYLNQFFAGIGGEQEANRPPEVIQGAVGPGRALEAALGDGATVVATVAAGDNYVAERIDEAAQAIVDLIGSHRPDVVVAGPAFNAGRYGTACGAVSAAVQRHLGVPAVTGMAPENPGVDLYRSQVLIVPTAESAAGMREAILALARLASKLGRGEPVGSARDEGYLPRGIRKNELAQQTGAERAVAMLVAKVRGEPYQTELPLPDFDPVTPAAPLADLSHALVALVTEAGIVPRGNPDGIEARRATKWAKYDVGRLGDLTAEEFTCVHGGFDNRFVHQDPDRFLPLDALRELERAGVIGKLHDWYYVTVGAGAPISRARKFGREIAQELLEAGVQAVVFSAT